MKLLYLSDRIESFYTTYLKRIDQFKQLILPSDDSPRDSYYQMKEIEDKLRNDVMERTQQLDPEALKKPAMDLTMMSYYSGILTEAEVSIDSLQPPQGEKLIEIDETFISRLKERAHSLGITEIGFCEVPNSAVFKENKIVYSHAIVCLQEMKKEEIKQAPGNAAGYETMRVYVELGKAINELSRWIADSGVPTQPGHPYRGQTLYPKLAVKANLGFQGKSGLLITPKYGSRVRIGAIYVPISNLPVSKQTSYDWGSNFCDRCNRCLRSCPGQAIYDTPIKTKYGNTCIDNTKCFPHFFIDMGCSVCIKVCPFNEKITKSNSENGNAQQ